MPSDKYEAFLSSFFVRPASLQFFKSAFVEPLDYPDIEASFHPSPDQSLKVVILDGHPRTGKTWVAAKAAASVVQELGLKKNQWWTAGEDSLAVCNPEDSLEIAVKKVLKALKPTFKLVLLDDFLGTNSPREIGASTDNLLSFFRWDSENPWLNAVAEDCVFIMVERSLFFTLDEIRLDSTIRWEEPQREQRRIVVVRNRHGLFRDDKSGAATGAFDEVTLAKVRKANLDHHPLRDLDGKISRSMLSNAPLVAFGMHNLSDDERAIVSRSLFGNDLVTISKWIGEREKRSDNIPRRERDELDLAYLVMIAPALVFLETAAYEELGVGRLAAESYRDKLYMSFGRTSRPSTGTQDGASGRVPNEFYVSAVAYHLRGRLNLVARVAWRLVGSSRTGRRGRTIGLLLRGMLERLIESGDPSARERLYDEPAWQHLVSSLKSSDPGVDILLYLERIEKSGDIKNRRQDLSPGLAAAMGWLLFKFKLDEEQNDAIHRLFASGLAKLLEAGADEGEIRSSFSPLLQWAIRTWREQRPSTGALERAVGLLPRSLSVNLILEDELIWGLFYEAKSPRIPRSHPVVMKVMEFLDERADSLDADQAAKSLLANRIFSLAWHNEWKPIAVGTKKGDLKNAQRAKSYFDATAAAAKELVRAEPALLDANLRYHWAHLVTQHAIWMRQWCFELDPNEYERRRAAPGSGAIADNDDLVEIFLALLAPGASGERVRDCLFLAGTRAQRLGGLESILRATDALTRQERDGDPEIEIGVLQAVFELMRQGYYNQPEKHKDPKQRKAQDDNWMEWEQWSRDTFARLAERRSAAWRMYYGEIERLSHRYDLLPSEERGWEQIMPLRWR